MKILDFPRVRQSHSHDCGPKALQAILVYYGIDAKTGRLTELTKTTAEGTSISNILATIKHYGLKIVSKAMTINEIVGYIDKNIPVMIVLQAWTKKDNVDWKNNWDDGHYVDVIGYDGERLIFMDPSCFYRTSLLYKNVLERWHDVESNGTKYLQHGIAVFGIKPKYKSIKIIQMD